ncbi:hypothetical protein [Sphingobacterium sp. LRF_L2]|uniref:hypothetical protein n=1 Tax=Sphingobacterium sp. LRF_L2 TaxID=3369421 RepID=UPI003F60ECD7
MKSINSFSGSALTESEMRELGGGFNPLGPISFTFEPDNGREGGGTINWYLGGTHYASTYFLPEHNWVYTSSYL